PEVLKVGQHLADGQQLRAGEPSPRPDGYPIATCGGVSLRGTRPRMTRMRSELLMDYPTASFSPCAARMATGSTGSSAVWSFGVGCGTCTSRCRCGPDAWPLAPTTPITCPARTC